MHDAPNTGRFACLGQRPDQLDVDPVEPSVISVQNRDQVDDRVPAFDKLRVGTVILGGSSEASSNAHKLRPTKPVPPSMRMSCMRVRWRPAPFSTADGNMPSTCPYYGVSGGFWAAARTTHRACM